MSRTVFSKKVMVYRDLPWNYAELLKWVTTTNNGCSVVKAFPKKPLSDRAFNIIKSAFKKWGGKFVSYRGEYYFELVIRKES